MLNQDKDRVPDEMGTHSSMPGLPQEASRPGVLLIRLWSTASRKLDCRPSKSNSPLLSLVLDLIRSSGGRSGTESADSLSASFPDVRAGMLCARRIQWATEGLTEYDAFRGAAAAILVDSANGSAQASGPANQPWEVDPGKIVVARSVCELIDGLPGVALGEATADGRSEWSWKTSHANASYATDEQAVLGMIQAAGRSDPGSSATQAETTTAPARASSRESPSRESPNGEFGNPAAPSLGRHEDTGRETSPRTGKSSRMPILIGSGAVLVIGVVALLFAFTRKAPVQSAVPSAPAPVSEAQPVEPAPKQAPAKTAPAAKKPAKVEVRPAVPTPVVSHCDLTDQEIQRSLARADLYLHGGDLSNARATYQHVLGCPSAHEKAQDGLNRIQRMAAQNGNPN
jgi:hypothetical protein